MKVGDLVQLSAYARRLKRNCARVDDVGIVTSKSIWGWFDVKWASDGLIDRAIDRREIKHAKAN